MENNNLPELREYFERKYPDLLPEATITALEKVIELKKLAAPAGYAGGPPLDRQPGCAGPGCPNYLFEMER